METQAAKVSPLIKALEQPSRASDTQAVDLWMMVLAQSNTASSGDVEIAAYSDAEVSMTTADQEEVF